MVILRPRWSFSCSTRHLFGLFSNPRLFCSLSSSMISRCEYIWEQKSEKLSFASNFYYSWSFLNVFAALRFPLAFLHASNNFFFFFFGKTKVDVRQIEEVSISIARRIYFSIYCWTWCTLYEHKLLLKSM